MVLVHRLLQNQPPYSLRETQRERERGRERGRERERQPQLESRFVE
jgi:hypothetical protein